MQGEQFTVLVSIPLKPGSAPEFLSLLDEVFESMRGDPTFVSATALQAMDDPDAITLVETWWDRENFEAVERKRAYRDRYEARLPELLRAPRTLAFHRTVRGILRTDPPAA